MVGIAGFVLRRRVVEAQRLGAVEQTSVMGTLRDHGRLLVRLACLSVFNAVGFYLLFVYIVSWI